MRTVTTTRLIEDLKDPANAAAWDMFDERYRPVLIAFGRRLGLSADDAAELAQQSLAAFSAALREGKYHRERGRLSSWLIGIAQRTAREMRRRRRVAPQVDAAGAAHLEPDAPESELSRAWRRERDDIVLVRAMALLRESTRIDERTLRAFDLFALRGVPAAETARECQIEVETVYVIKNRLTKRLREIVHELTTAYDEDG